MQCVVVFRDVTDERRAAVRAVDAALRHRALLLQRHHHLLLRQLPSTTLLGDLDPTKRRPLGWRAHWAVGSC